MTTWRPWLSKPNEPGYWWLDNAGKLSLKEVRQGKTCLCVGYCDVAKYPGLWQKAIGPTPRELICPICKAQLNVDGMCKPCGMDYEELFGPSTWEGFEG